MARTLAYYTFDNTIGDCLPTVTPTTEFTIEDTVNDTITTRYIYVADDYDAITIKFNVSPEALLTMDYLRVNNKTTDISSLFYGCSNLKSVKTENWDTQNVTDMQQMFRNCQSLKELDLSSLNTSSVNNMSLMFLACRNLEKLNVSNFNTEKVITMKQMFNSCGKLKELDVSSWNPSSVTDVGHIFYGCSSLTSLNLQNWTMENVSSISYMFDGCINLQSLNMQNFNSFKLKYMDYTFNNCQSLKTLDLTSFKTSGVGATEGTFNKVKAIVYVNANTWTLDTSSYDATFVSLAGRLITSYKYNSDLYADLVPEFTGLTTNQYIVSDLDTNSTIEIDTSAWVLGILNIETGAEEANSNNYRSDYIEVLPSVRYEFNDYMRFCFYDADKKFISGESEYLTYATVPQNAKYIRVYRSTKPNPFTMTTLYIKTRAIASDTLPTMIRFGKTSTSDGNPTDATLSLLEVLEMNTSNVTDMSFMFRLCQNLTTINTEINTSKVTQMQYAFCNCASITSINVSNWDTSQVTTMLELFNNCSRLTSLDVSNWDVSRVKSLYRTFRGCALSSLDVSKWNTESLTDVSGVFAGCSNLEVLNVSNWKMDKVVSIKGMFQSCSKLKVIDVSNWNTSTITDTASAFAGCSNLEVLNVSNWDTKKFNSLESFFRQCSKLKVIDVSNWDVSSVTNMYFTFQSCSSLLSLDVSKWNTNKVLSMQSMFDNCSSLTELDLSSFNTNKVTNFSNLFGNCTNLVTLDISNFHFGGVNQNPGATMFSGCNSLKNIGMVYCRPSSFNSLQAAFNNLKATPVNVYYHDASLSDLTTHAKVNYVYYDKSTVTLPYELNKLPNGVADYIDVVNGVYVQIVGKQVLDSTWNWSKAFEYDTCIDFRCGLENLVNQNSTNGLCDKLHYNIDNNLEKECAMLFAHANVSQWIIVINKSRLTTNDVEGFKTWLANNPTTVLYELKTPIYTPLTDEEKASLPLSAYANGYIQLSSDELRPSKFEFRAKSSNRMQLDMLETGHYYLNAPTGNVKLGTTNVDVQQMPCIIRVDNVGTGDSGYRLGFSGNIMYTDVTSTFGGFISSINGTIDTNGEGDSYTDFIKVKPNSTVSATSYIESPIGNGYGIVIGEYNSNKGFIKITSTEEKTKAITTTDNTYYIRVSYRCGSSDSIKKIKVGLPPFITLSKLPSHRIPTTFTQGMKSSVDFGYWQGMISAIASRFTGRDGTTYTEYISFSKLPNITESTSYGLTLRRITGKYGTTVTVEDEFDISTGKYIKRVGKYVIDGSVTPYTILEHDEQYNIQKVVFLSSKTGIKGKLQWDSAYGLAITDSLKFSVNYSLNEQHIFMASGNITLFFKAGTFGAFTLENVQNYFKENPMTVYYELETPEIIYVDLPQNIIHTSANRTDIETWKGGDGLFPQVKPAPLSYPTTLSPNTQYTVFHNRKNYSGSVKTPMINLGGTEVAATGSRTVVTTPSTLAHNELQFIGGENTVEQVMVIHGDWTKEGKTVDYFEGLQSSVIGDKTLENLVDKPTEIWSNKVTDSSNGGALDYVSMDDIIAVAYGNRAKLPEVQVGTNVRTHGMTLQNLAVQYECIAEPNTYTRAAVYDGVLPAGTYIFFYNVVEPNPTTQTGGSERFTPYYTCQDGDSYYEGWETHNQTTGLKYWKFTATSPITMFRFWIANIDASCSANNFMLLQYQQGMENWNIPFFEGMKSVENPVLTTTGKNLFNGNLENGGYTHLTGVKEEKADALRSVDFIKVEPSSTICCSNNGIARNTHIFEYDENKTFLKFNDTITKVILSPSTRYITFYGGNHDRDMFQLEKGDIITPYEPYKESILSTPQGTVLRGVGSYKDAIGWNDGIIRRNCVEFTITGEEGYNWINIVENTNTVVGQLSWDKLGLKNKITKPEYCGMCCDKLVYVYNSDDYPHIRQDGNSTGEASLHLIVYLDKTKFSTYTSQGINDYIKSIGGLTIVAPLADTQYEDVEITGGGNWKEFVLDETITNTDVLIFNHGTLYTTTDTHPSTFSDFSLKTTNRYTIKDFDKLKYTVLTEQPFYLNGVDYPASPTGMTIIDVTGIADSSIYSDDTMITVVQDDGNYYADGVLTQFKGEKTFVKEFVRTSNGTYNTGMTLLEPLQLNSIPHLGVYDTYNTITGTIIKNTHTVTITGYEKIWENPSQYSAYVGHNQSSDSNYSPYTAFMQIHNLLPFAGDTTVQSTVSDFACDNVSGVWGGSAKNRILGINAGRLVVVRIPYDELSEDSINGFIEFVKKNPITFTYKLAEPQIIQATPTSTYISTRPKNGNIIAQDTQIQAEYLNYNNEQSIISPRMLGDGDEIRWEQGSQCYVYENDNEYIPLTDYDELFGANIQAQEYTQYAESVDGTDIELGVALKEKAVYEQTYVKYEDNVVYPETMENIDETNGVEVDYICGATWQNPNDLSDIRHLGELREDGQYDVTIRRSGDDEIRLLEGTTHISLDYDELPSSEFELTFFNGGGVEVGKYGATTHMLEDCVENSKLASGTVYGQTLVNLIDFKANSYQSAGSVASRGINTITFRTNSTGKFNIGCTVDLKPSAKYCIKANIQSTNSVSFRVCDVKANYYPISETIPVNGEYIGTFTASSYATTGQVTFYRGTTVGEETITGTVTLIEYIDGCENWLEHFEGMCSTVVNGFSSCGKNLWTSENYGSYYNAGHTYVLKGYKPTYPVTLSSKAQRTISKGVHVKPNTYYTISITNCDLDISKYYLIATWYRKEEDAISDSVTTPQYVINTNSSQGTTKTFRTPSDCYYMVCGFAINYTYEQQGGEIVLYEEPMIQVEEGQTVTEFEEPKTINYSLPTPITLRKAGDVCDTFDVVSGVETRNTVITTITGDSHTIDNSDITEEYRQFIIRLNTNEYIKRLARTYVETDEYYIYTTANFQDNIYVRMYKQDGLTDSFDVYRPLLIDYLNNNPLIIMEEVYTPIKTKHTLIPSTTQTTQEPTFILPQPLRSVPNGICDRLYWDENKGHYCIEKRIGYTMIDGTNKSYNYELGSNKLFVGAVNMFNIGTTQMSYGLAYSEGWKTISDSEMNKGSKTYPMPVVSCYNTTITVWIPGVAKNTESYVQYFRENPTKIYHAINPEIIDLPHLDKKVELLTQPDIYPIGYKAVHEKANPEIGLTIPYKVLNMPTQPVNLNFVMDIADYVLTWDDVKEARQYNIILNDEVIATVKEPQYNTGEEMYGYILVEANNEIGDNLSEELYIKTVPNAPAQLTVAHNPLTDHYDFEISFIDTSDIADYYTVMYKVDGGEWVINTIQNSELTTGERHLWSFSVYEIKESIEVWATATNDVGTNDILPSAIYYMSPTPQWTYRINSKDVFLRWLDESPYDTKYKLRYSYKSNGQFQYAYFEGDAAEIGKLYEAVLPLAEDDEVTLALCIISEKENLYCKPVKASKPLDPNIVPPMNFNYHWLARGLIEFYWEDQYDVDVEYEYILESMKANETLWTQVNKIIPSEDVEGTGTIYRVEYQLEDLEQIRMKVRMKWAMNETEWTETLTTVFIPVEGNPPTYIRRTQTAEGLLVEWEAQAYIDSYHVYVIDNETGEELQHLETSDNSILVDLDYSNSIEIAIYEISRFSGGIESDPTDAMVFTPTMFTTNIDQRIYQPCAEKYPIEVSTVQKGNKQAYVIHDVSYTPNVETEHEIGVSIATPFTISYHPMMVDVHQAGSRDEHTINAHIKTLDVRNEDLIRVMTFERITDVYDMDFRVYTPSVASYPINLEVSKVRIVCLGDSLTSGHPFYWAETGTGDITASYPYQLSRRLKNQYEVINSGYGSDTTDRCLARFDKDVLRYQPQYCIFQCGTNDLYWAMAESLNDQNALDMKMAVVRDNTMEVAKRCWDAGIIPIIGTLIPRTGATGIYKTALFEHNEWIISWCNEQAAAGRDIFYVDFFNAGKDVVPPTPLEDPNNPGAMNPIYDGDNVYDEWGNLEKQGRGIHLNPEGYGIMASAVPTTIFQTYDTGLKMYQDAQCTIEDEFDDSDAVNPFYTISIDNVRRGKTKPVVRYVKNIGRTQVLFAMYTTDHYNCTIEFIGSDGSTGAFANGLLAPDMIAKVTMNIDVLNKDSKASFNMHLASREYSQS